MHNANQGVSKIIGVVILVVIVIMLSVGVLFTAQTLIGDQPQDMTAGTTDERVDFYTHEAQLVNQGNTDNVYAVSPLGTEYKLENAGDLQKILPLKKGSHPSVDQYQIVGERDGQRQLLKTNHFEEGVQPDVVVHDDGDKDYETIQGAINNIDDDTERDISSSNPGVIVVQKGVYKENIEVSDDITLIAEYGTVIQDANPNEDVVDIRGDNVRFQNFEVDGNPNPDDLKHYSRHGINVQGDDVTLQGNTIYRADSPDITSAAVRVNGENSVVRYNNMRESQQSINFGPDSAAPAVCGNQFESGIGGSVTTQTQKDVATLNHWNGGMPSNLARTVIAAEQKENNEDGEEDSFSLPSETPREFIQNTNSRVDPSILGDAAGQASLPFTGTKMGTSETPGECELSISLVNDPEDGTSINIEEIQVTINGQTTTVEVVQEVNLGDGERADTRDVPTATCDCGGDGSYDPGDRISVSESSFGEIQTYTTEGTLEPLPFTEGEGSEPTPSSFNIQSSGGSSISTTSYSSPTPTSTDNTNDEQDSTQSNDGGEVEDFRILLGSSIDINLADEVILEPVISGAESDPEDIEYDWSLGDGSTSTDRVVRHVYDNAGTYTVELTVTDPATGETDTDTTTITVEEGTKDVEQIKDDEQQRLSDLVQEDPDGEGKVLYLEEGVTYTTLDTISAKDLTIIGKGDNVVLDGPITVQSSGVTFKNVAIEDGLVVQNNDFKLYNSEVSNVDGYAVEFDANGDIFQIGDSTLTGENGVYVGVDRDVLLSGNTIDATGSYGVYTSEAVKNVRVKDNTISSNDIGIYESLAVTSEYKRNTINAPTTLEQKEATAPEINDISVQFTATDVPLALSTQVNDPDGYPIDEVTWEVNGETFTRHPSNDLIYTFDEAGEYTVTVTVTDQFGKTTTDSKTVQIEEFEATLTTADEASINDQVTAGVDYNIPENRIHSIEYEWGNGESDTVGSSSYTHTYTEQGTYDVTVTVNPDEGESRTVTDSITIVDSPVADFAIEDPLYAGESIQFNGEYSTAPDGESLTYEWNMGDGTTYTSESPQHTYSDTGTYDVTLTVSDGEYTDSISAQVEVLGFTADASGPSTVGVGKDAEFDVTSSIGDSNIDEYIVDYDGDGQGDASYTSVPFTHTFDSAGERDVTIDAVSGGTAVRNTVTVDVRELPEFDITSSSTEIEADESVTFSAVNVDAKNPTYDWNFDDGTTSLDGKDATHTYTSPGVYTVELTVTDEEGISQTKTVEITVGGDFQEGLVAHFPFDTASDGTSPNMVDTFDANLNGGTITSDAVAGSGALVCSDASGSVDINDGNGIDFGTGEYTVSVWVKSSTAFDGSSDNTQIWSQRNPNHELQTADGEISHYSGGTTQRTPHNLGENWHHVVLIRDDTGTLKTYVDGTLIGTKDSTSNDVSDNSRYGVCDDPSNENEHFNGYVDDLRFYNWAMTDIGVNDLRDATAGATASFDGPTAVQDGETVTFDASDSFGPSPLTYEWDLNGDGTTDATGETVDHTYTTTGDKQVTLTLTSGDGDTDTMTQSVSVATYTDNGQYTWYHYDYNEMGHPNTQESFHSLFDNSNEYVQFGGTGEYSGTVAWSVDTGDKPSYLPSNAYSWKYEGVLYVPESGTYDIGLASDDTGELMIDGERIVGQYSSCTPKGDGPCLSDSVDLTEGYHSITIRMEEGSGGDGVSAYWQKPGDSSWRFIPDQNLMGTPSGSLDVDASYTPSTYYPQTGETVTFDASQTVAESGATYEWDFNGDGTTDATGETVSHTFNSEATETVELTVTGSSSTNTDSVTRNIKVTETTSSGQAYWYTYDYGQKGHPTTTAGMDNLFDNSENYVTYGGRDRYDGEIAWDDAGDIPGKPSYLPADEYSWKYEGAIYVPETKTYSFGLASDDGSDLFIDGQKVVNRYDTSCDVGPADVCSSGSVTLDEGFHTITTRVEEGTGGDGIALYWQHETVSGFDETSGWNLVPDENLRGYETEPLEVDTDFTPTPETPTTGETITFDGSETAAPSDATYEWDLNGDGTTDATGETVTHSYSTEGEHDVTLTVTADTSSESKTRSVHVNTYSDTISYEWYNYDYDSMGHPTSTTELTNLFDSGNSGVTYGGSGTHNNRVHWHSGQWDSKPSYLPGGSYSWKVDGYIYVPESGTYTFGVDSDDASDIIVDGEVVTSWYGGHGVDDSYRSGSIHLEKGFHPIKIRVEEGGGGDGISAAWQKPGDSSWQLIPEENLYGE